ncbi:unnamed protein product [Bursaphelenchus xylophilus]|uniref:(pine wood nematode) hypothetical protein n=1 Tax=Bursaphelenchus xylophilus TaxID=6326 RepID=A0A1I7S5T7_BURXY|nr:unnamed protein product [Bursaphelenchus xylophilus]CAG9125053.1 unnamed protein product [Bursaphelenchus xylophilus]
MVLLVSNSASSTSTIRTTTRRNFTGKRQVQREPAFVLRCPSPARTRHPHRLRISMAFYFNNSLLLQIDNGTVLTFDKLKGTSKVIQWKTFGDFNSAIVLWKNGKVRFEYEEKRHWYAMRIKSAEFHQLRGNWRCRMLVVSARNGKIHKAKYESKKWYGPQTTYFVIHKNQTTINPTVEYDRIDNRATKIKLDDKKIIKKETESAFDDSVIFTKPNEDFTVFHRMSRYRELAYIRNSDIKDERDEAGIQVGKITYVDEPSRQRNYSSVHALPANFCTKNQARVALTLLASYILQLL